jgi:hypothetical protein
MRIELLCRTFFTAAALVLGAILGGTGSARADFIIDTTPFWNGTSSIGTFGIPDTQTYGQVITTPSGTTALKSFTFYLNLPNTLAFNGEVYAWDGFKATGGSLYESGTMSGSGSGQFDPVTFTPGGLVLKSGQQYVLFASSSRQNTGHSGSGTWAQPQSQDVYSGGGFVFLNNGNNPALWTSQNWTQNYLGPGSDLTFKAVFTDPPTNPEPSSVALLAIGLAGLIMGEFHRRGRRGRREISE